MKNKIRLGRIPLVISVGGSLIATKQGIDTAFLKSFRSLVRADVSRGRRFFLIAGGGKLCRDYQSAASQVAKVTNTDLDWLGIHSTRLNAHLLRITFGDIAHSEIIKDPTMHKTLKKKVVIAGGWKPGWSTDYVAVKLAEEYKTDTIINISNIDYVYDRDPKLYGGAEKIEKISWADFRRIIGSSWKPGANLPFDPVASRKAQQLGLRVIIINGRSLDNLRRCLNGKDFKGTVIQP